MPVAVYKTYVAGEVLTASDLNNSFTTIVNGFNNSSVTNPLSVALDLDGYELILDADADTSLTADTDDQIDFKLSGTDYFRMTAGRFTAVAASIAEAEGTAVASAATADIWGDTGNTKHITGTTTITSFGTAPQAGAWMKVVFDGALTLTHGANLNLPGSANITTAADDFAFVYADTTTQFDVLYFPKTGISVVPGAASTLTGTTLAANVVTSSLTSVGTITTGVWTGTTIAVANGGTGLTAGTSGGVLAYTAAGTLASSAALAANQLVLGGGAGVVPATLGSLGSTTTVLHGNAGGAPTFSAVSLTTDISGILPTANGGTGIAYFTAAGPTVARVYTFPDAATTILTTNAAVTVAQGGTGSTTAAAAKVALGLETIPQNSQSANYTTVLGDAGKHILHPTADNNARTFTIDSNANVAYVIGTAITFVNQINTVTIAITSDTMTLSPGGTTGSRTLAANGIATALKVSATGWVISGTGLT